MNVSSLVRLTSPTGSYLEGRICTCGWGGYKCDPALICKECARQAHRVECLSPPCLKCGGLPAYKVRHCVRCKEIFYSWMEGGFLQTECIECLGEFYQGRKPHASLIRPKLNAADISIDDFPIIG